MIARKILYEGKVQGVGFRWTVRHLANGFEIRGRIENLPDGSVELSVQGEAEEVDAFLQAIRESNLAGHIAQETPSAWCDAPTTLRGFQIL